IAKSHGKCEVVSPEIEIVVNDPTPESKAGESQILCNETSYKLNANDAGHFTGTWRDSDPLSKLSFSPDNHAHNATVSNLVAGKTYVLEWVISGVSPCPDERSAVTLTVRKPVTQATVGEKQEICILKDNSNNHTVLTGNLPDISNGEKGFWKLLSGPEGLIFEDANQAKTKVSNLKGGVYKLEWNISSDASSADASCKTSSAQLIISVVDYPTLG